VASGSYNYDILYLLFFIKTLQRIFFFFTDIFFFYLSPPEIIKTVLIERPDLEEDAEALKMLAYQKWIDQISEDYKTDINPNDIIGLIFYSNK